MMMMMMMMMMMIITRVLAVEISCPHSLDNRVKKDFEMTEKYQPLFFGGGGWGEARCREE